MIILPPPRRRSRDAMALPLCMREPDVSVARAGENRGSCAKSAPGAADREDAMTKPRLFTVSLLTAAASLALSQPAAAQDDRGAQLGKVHFETSCNEAAQQRFDRGMRYQHSFWYSASREIFEDVLKADPDCAIAYWGIALSLLNNPFIGTPPASNLPLGLAALEKGKAVGAKTQRERDYVDALAVFYTGYDKTDHRTRIQAYVKAMEQLAQRYPNDDEAQMYYALALNVAAPPADKTYANQLKAASILEAIFQRQPYHPGVAHYLIHTYDYPAIASKGLDAAKRYAEIAAAAPHGLHMPSHIFTRVGYWKESIASNGASVREAKAHKELHDQLHGMDYLVYAHLQLAQDRQAKDVVDDMNRIQGFNPEVRTGPFALAASPARYMVERGDWKGAAELPVRPTRFAYVDAITHFARALGAARSGDAAAAEKDAAELAQMHKALQDAKDNYWATEVEVQRLAIAGWIALAQGKSDDALKFMGAAADLEDKNEKSIVTPGRILPARELLGDMLLELKQPAQALKEYEASHVREPNRFRGFYGAALAAEGAGDRKKAADYYAKLMDLAKKADSQRPELARARAYVAQR
jgi:tetratricopeptide (TPR) repeat protein